MKNKFILTTALSAFAFSGIAFAQGTNGSGSLGVTATVTGSILVTFSKDGSGMAMTGANSSAASLAFSTVQMFGGAALATNETRTLHGLASFDISTPFDIRVDIANDPSLTYTLSALLASTDSVNNWSVGGFPITATTGSDHYDRRVRHGGSLHAFA